MNNWKVIFATVVIFGAGVLTGGLLVNYVQHSYVKPSRAKVEGETTVLPVSLADNSKLRPPEILSKQFLQQLDRNLSLKSDQREAVHKIIGEGQNQIRKAVQDAKLEIRDVLTPEQQRAFDDLIKRPFRKSLYSTNAEVPLPLDDSGAVEDDTNLPTL